MGANDAGMRRACAEGPSVHAPNPNQEEAFPLLVIDVRNGVNNPPRLGFKRMHWHNDLQFIVVSKGSANIDCAGRHFNCAKGCGAFFNSNVPHRIMSDAKTEYMSFIFPEKLLGFFQGSEMAAFGVSPFVGPRAQPTAHFDLAAPWHREVLNELVRARALLASKKATGVERYRACAHLLAAWSVYVLNVEQRIPTKAERATNERMKAFTLFIDANYNRDISLEDIAKAGNVSKAECARCFKKLTLRPHTKGETRTMIAKQGATIDGNGDKLANYLTMAGRICSDINQGALSAILPFLVVGSGYTYFEATMLVFAANIASAVIQPLFGWLGDKRPSPWFMALGVFLAGLGMAGIGYAQSYWHVVASATASGIGVAMFHPEGGRLSNLAAGARKGNGMSIFAVGGNIGFFVGPILCATFLTAFGLHGTAVFLIPAAACSVVLLCFNGRFKRLGVAAEKAGGGSGARERWDLFGLVMGMLSLRSVLTYGLMAFIPLFLVGELGQTEALGSAALSAFAIAGAAATALSGRTAEKTGALRLAIACCAVEGAGIVAFVLNDVVAVAIAITLVLAVALDLFYPSTVALGMGYLPRHLGMASGLSYGVAVCVGGAAEPLLGSAGDAAGLVPVMLALAAVAFAGAALGLLLKHLQDKAAPERKETKGAACAKPQ